MKVKNILFTGSENDTFYETEEYLRSKAWPKRCIDSCHADLWFGEVKKKEEFKT